MALPITLPEGVLTQLLQIKTLPNALCFVGDNPTAQKQLFVEWIKTRECQQQPADQGAQNNTQPTSSCGVCNNCSKIDHNHFFGVHYIAPDSNHTNPTISIEAIRELHTLAHIKPFDADIRIIFIEQAQRLNTNAANALLKLLEEPPKFSRFVLTAPSVHSLLPTIRSRCQFVRLPHFDSEADVSKQQQLKYIHEIIYILKNISLTDPNVEKVTAILEKDFFSASSTATTSDDDNETGSRSNTPAAFREIIFELLRDELIKNTSNAAPSNALAKRRQLYEISRQFNALFHALDRQVNKKLLALEATHLLRDLACL